MEPTQDDKINAIAEQLKTYSSIQVELFKLRAIEKVAVSGSRLVSGFLLFSVLIITLVFLSTAMAFYLSQLLGNIISGFMVVGVFYLLMTIVFFLFRKKILHRRIADKIIYTLSTPEQ